MIARLDSSSANFEPTLAALLHYEAAHDHSIEATVRSIISEVRTRGDAALIEYTAKFDRFTPAALEVTRQDLEAARAALDSKVVAALEAAAARVRSYHERQRVSTWQYDAGAGSVLGQKITPLDRVGLYVPGGKAAYPSSVLMNAIPAKVAGVGELIMVVPTPDGLRNDAVLAAALIAGVDRVFTVGGAQAVAALAYGTASIPAVNKITGPGNAYVAEAKRQVFGQVGIDMIAGPSEILVLCDGDVSAGANPDWVAMDLFSQAEHDEMAQAILLCPDDRFIEAVQASIAKLLPQMPRRNVIEQSLKDRGALIKVRDMQEACAITNRIAPEHLEIIAKDSQACVDAIRHAGAIFIGAYASESLGDYCAGPNHVLPTMRTARFSSPLGVYDFQKRSSLIKVSAQDAQGLGKIAATLAYSEGLQAHARSAEMRLDAALETQAQGQSLINRFVRDDVLAMSAYKVPDVVGMIKLDSMENPYGLPEALKASFGERMANVAMNRYPIPSYQGVKAALRKAYAIPQACGIVVGNGSDELIALLSIALAKDGACILAPEPGFVMYQLSAQFANVPFVGVPLDKNFELDLPAMLAAIKQHQPALVYLAYPNNPTGNCWNREAMQAIIDSAPGFVVIDEAYQPFALDTWMPLAGQAEKLIVMRTVSKMGLAGIRLGYMAGPAALMHEIEKVRPPYNVNVLTEAAALFCLEHVAHFDAQADAIRGERDRFLNLLKPLALEVFPSKANFFLTRFADGNAVHRFLWDEKIAVKNVAGMHASLRSFLRLTVGAPQETDALIAALKRAPSAITLG